MTAAAATMPPTASIWMPTLGDGDNGVGGGDSGDGHAVPS